MWKTQSTGATDSRRSSFHPLLSELFSRHGVDFAFAQKAEGWTNETWLAGGLVLRLSRQGNSDRLSREIKLSSFLPTAVGYPRVIDSGVLNGFEWCMLEEIPGKDLGKVWPDLGWEERISIIGQIWEKARAVHSVGTEVLRGLIGTEPWFNTTDPGRTERSLTLFTEEGIFTEIQTAILRERIAQFRDHLGDSPGCLNHGDLTMENMMYRDGRIVSLLDFEHAVIAPIELDLCNLVKIVLEPEDPCPASSSEGSTSLRDATIALALPVLDRPGGKVRFMGYAILKEVRHLEDHIAHRWGGRDFRTWQPYKKLVSMLSGTGGHLAAFR